MTRVHEIAKMSVEEKKALETNEKVLALKMKLDEAMPNITHGTNEIEVNRECLIQDSLQKFKEITDLKPVLKVTFVNEVSQDVGGISREFFTAIMKELFNAELGLFTYASTEQFSFKIAEDSNEIGDW